MKITKEQAAYEIGYQMHQMHFNLGWSIFCAIGWIVTKSYLFPIGSVVSGLAFLLIKRSIKRLEEKHNLNAKELNVL